MEVIIIYMHRIPKTAWKLEGKCTGNICIKKLIHGDFVNRHSFYMKVCYVRPNLLESRRILGGCKSFSAILTYFNDLFVIVFAFICCRFWPQQHAVCIFAGRTINQRVSQDPMWVPSVCRARDPGTQILRA